MFLHRHDLNLKGTSDVMRANKTYICSVSATPYAERAKMLDGTALPKHAEVLRPGPGYFGLKHYAAAGLLRPTFDIHSDPDAFKTLLTRTEGAKWVLMRSLDKKTINAVRRICAEAGVPVKQFTSKRRDIGDNMEALETAPAVTTLVLLKGKCRVGKVVPKRHIAFVWEDSAKPATDTLVQALPGRMCGYESAFGAEKPVIYVPAHSLTEHHTALTLDEGRDGNKVSELDRHTACASGMEVSPLSGKNIVAAAPPKLVKTKTFQCPPLKLHMATIPRKSIKDCLLAQLARENAAALKADPNWELLTADQKAEILYSIGALGSAEVAGARRFRDAEHALHLRSLHHTTAADTANYFKEVADAHASHTTAAESTYAWRRTESAIDVSCVLFHVVHADPYGAGMTPGDIYVVFNTYAPPALPAINRQTRVPKTLTDTVFDAVDVVVPAADSDDEDEEEEEEESDDDDPVAPAPACAGAGAPPVAATVPAPYDLALLRQFLATFVVTGATGEQKWTPALCIPKAICAGMPTNSQKKTIAAILKPIGDVKGVRLTGEAGTGSDYENNLYLKRIAW
jgi:hypothetical protein